MKLVKVLVVDGFSSMEDGAYGPGVCEMRHAVAIKYPAFVTILENVETQKPAAVAPKVVTPKVAAQVQKRTAKNPTAKVAVKKTRSTRKK